MSKACYRKALAAAAILGCCALSSCSPRDARSAFTPSLDSLLAAGAIDTSIQNAWADSTAVTREIHGRWMAYLESGMANPGRACARSPFWLQAEQERWQCHALGLLYIPLHATSQVVRIEQDQGNDDVYRVLTLFRSDSARSPLRSPITLLTVFAVRSDTAWVFANALPRYTASWPDERVGAITYVRPPDEPFQRDRALAAGRFTDSLATLFAVQGMDSLRYFVLPTIDDVYRIMGLQTPIRWGPLAPLEYRRHGTEPT